MLFFYLFWVAILITTVCPPVSWHRWGNPSCVDHVLNGKPWVRETMRHMSTSPPHNLRPTNFAFHMARPSLGDAGSGLPCDAIGINDANDEVYITCFNCCVERIWWHFNYINMYVYLSICLSVCLSVYLSIYLFVVIFMSNINLW